MNVEDLRTGIWGYRKSSVFQYITALENQFSDKMEKMEKEHQNAVADYQEKLQQKDKELQKMQRQLLQQQVYRQALEQIQQQFQLQIQQQVQTEMQKVLGQTQKQLSMNIQGNRPLVQPTVQFVPQQQQPLLQNVQFQQVSNQNSQYQEMQQPCVQNLQAQYSQTPVQPTMLPLQYAQSEPSQGVTMPQQPVLGQEQSGFRLPVLAPQTEDAQHDAFAKTSKLTDTPVEAPQDTMQNNMQLEQLWTQFRSAWEEMESTMNQIHKSDAADVSGTAERNLSLFQRKQEGTK